MNNFSTRIVRVGELPDFIAEYLAGAPPNAILPITPQRAKAQAHNPAASADDPALLLALSSGEVVGYLGLLPVFLRDGGRVSKVFWFSTWLAAPQVRGRGVGRMLKQKALSLGIDAVSTGNIHTRQANRKLGCAEREPFVFYSLDLTGVTLFNPLRLGRRALRKALHALGRDFAVETASVRAADRFLATPLHKTIAARLRAYADSWLKGLKIAETPRIPEIPPQEPRPLPVASFHRPPVVVNWMLEYPWVLPRAGAPNFNYHFTHARDEFRFQAFTLHDGKRYVGFAVFSLSADGGKRWVKALDYRLSRRLLPNAVLALALKVAIAWRAHRLELPPELAEPLKAHPLTRPLLSEHKRIYQAWFAAPNSPLAQAWERLTFGFCDGDTAFT